MSTQMVLVWARYVREAFSRKPGREPMAYRVGCRRGSALLPPPSLPARDHSTLDLALSPLHLELSRRRGAAGRARARHLLRNRTALGAEVRSRDRTTAASASPSAERSLASRRDGGADRRRADVSVACRRSREWGPRHADPAPTRQSVRRCG